MGKNKNLIKKFIPYFKPYKGILIMDLLCASLTTVSELILPLFARHITERATTAPELLTVNFVLTIGIVYFLIKIVDSAAYFYMASVGHIMGTKIETDMRRDFFEHLQKLSFSFYDKAKIGQLMSRITTDMFDITEFAHHCPEELFITSIKIIVSFIILCTFNIPLTLIIFSIIPFMLFVLIILNRKMRSGFRNSRKQLGEINSSVEDCLLGIRVVKSFTNEAIEKKKFGKGNDKFLEIKKYLYKYMGLFQTSNRFFEGFMYIVVVVVGALFLIYKQITPADYLAYLLFVTTLLASIRKIVDFTEQFQRGMTGIERFNEIMDIEPDISDKKNAYEINDVKGNIIFNNVTFSYDTGEKSVINNLDLEIKSGTNVAIVGPSGSGKTTICNLIPRFYSISEGEILIDGHNIEDIKLKSLRENIGIVQQDVYLFSGTVKENIRYGKLDATDDEIIQAAKLAGADEFISSLENGYDTYVGERGLRLSGGQKQRISIARVFLKNPPILILDEATSALDNESEFIVQKSLERLSKGRTTLTIAHRLTTIQNADRILVLTDEGIVEDGNHEELINKKGVYHSLYLGKRNSTII